MTLRLKEQADQLAADKLQLTEAIQDIFHQIRTPLTSMNLIVSMLREENLPYERRLPMTQELVVTGSGPGFASEDLPRLFERFYKGQGSSEDSVGIGLALSRSILAAQNGTVKAENRPDGGARFTIRFYKSVV